MSKSELESLREGKNIKIDEIVDNLNISKEYIIAIEHENFDILPERVYTVGFIRSYTEFIGIPSQPYVDKYLKFLSDASKDSKKTYIKNLKRKNKHTIKDFLFLLDKKIIIFLEKVKSYLKR